MAKAKTYVGNGWKSKFGIHLHLKREQIAKLPVDKYGDILLEVCERREQDPRSKATHYIIVNDFLYERLEQESDEVSERERQGFQPNDPLL